MIFSVTLFDSRFETDRTHGVFGDVDLGLLFHVQRRGHSNEVDFGANVHLVIGLAGIRGVRDLNDEDGIAEVLIQIQK